MHLSQSVPTSAVSVDPASGLSTGGPYWVKATATGVLNVTPFDGGTAINYTVAAAPDEVPFAVRAIGATGAGTTVTNGNIIASKLEG